MATTPIKDMSPGHPEPTPNDHTHYIASVSGSSAPTPPIGLDPNAPQEPQEPEDGEEHEKHEDDEGGEGNGKEEPARRVPRPTPSPPVHHAYKKKAAKKAPPKKQARRR